MVVGRQPPHETASRRIARYDYRPSLGDLRDKTLSAIEPQARLAGRFIRPVTLKTLVCKQRPNISVKAHRAHGPRLGGNIGLLLLRRLPKAGPGHHQSRSGERDSAQQPAAQFHHLPV